MKQTVVPNRNAIFSSLLFATALSLQNNTTATPGLHWASTAAIMRFTPTVGQRSTPPSNTRSRLGIGTQST